MTFEEEVEKSFGESVVTLTSGVMKVARIWGNTFGALAAKDLTLSVAIGVFMNVTQLAQEDTETALEEFLAAFAKSVRRFDDPAINRAVELNKNTLAERRERNPASRM